MSNQAHLDPEVDDAPIGGVASTNDAISYVWIHGRHLTRDCVAHMVLTRPATGSVLRVWSGAAVAADGGGKWAAFRFACSVPAAGSGVPPITPGAARLTCTITDVHTGGSGSGPVQVFVAG
jgi:hypothetical protein